MILHASCVAFGGRAALLTGPAGSGKSALALALMARGAGLVADDRTALHADGGRLVASAPPGLPAAIEARGIGLLNAPLTGPATVVLLVDLGAEPDEAAARLPPQRSICVAGCTVDLVCGPVRRHFADAIRQYLLMGRYA
jgi:HPr kinase/phosphorylase